MKKAHIISHSHWDREWYLPYETHHMLLIEFMDTLIETLEKDPEYKSFHLDGQTILIEDYLQVRPENEKRLEKLIKEQRIHVGPWYILQDEFLTSSEANIRNLQMGHKVAKQYGPVCKVGYFPDSFGNIGQAPQILRKAGIETAVFGRGVKPTGFNNQVGESTNYESPYSEMYWESGDGSKVLAILFANWYSNGIEVPVDDEEAKDYWDKKLPEAIRYASTNHLLYMNGCDHQPVQTDLSQAIRRAKALYPDVEFVHSNFVDYIKEVKQEIPQDMSVIKGELRSQQTDGWYTLANTASSRVYIKQMNIRCQMLFEKIAEPLATLAYQKGMDYPHHLFTYGWKLLMQNHPHDSICGCSVDEVHAEMVTRFKKAEGVAMHIIEESKKYLSSKIDTRIFAKYDEGAIPFMIFNTIGWERSGIAEIEVEVMKKYFREGTVPSIVEEMKNITLPQYKVIDEKGSEVFARIEVLPNHFNYELPKDRFRQPYIAKRVKVTLEVQDIPSFGWNSFALVETDNKTLKAEEKASLITVANIKTDQPKEYRVETEYLKVKINPNGSLQVTDKQSGQTFDNLCIYEDCGDIGNEYIYFMPKGDTPITTKDTIGKIKILEDEPHRAVVEVRHTLEIPSKANEVLDQEIQDLVEFKERKAARGTKIISQEIVTEYTFERLSLGIKVKTSFNNKALDHRLRALFETNLNTAYHYADSIFEVAKRDTVPSKEWENPCNAQHQQAFVNVHTDECGLTVANKGLCEYEVLRDGKNTIAITLHRGVRELGDWGVFLTPDAQCLGEQMVEFEIIPHGKETALYESYQEAYCYQVDWTTSSLELQQGELPSKEQLLDLTQLEVVPSSLKVNEITGDMVGRWYNLDNKQRKIEIEIETDLFELYKTDLLEENNLGKLQHKISVGTKEIMTVGFKKKG